MVSIIKCDIFNFFQLSTMKRDKDVKRKEARAEHMKDVMKRKAAEDALHETRVKKNMKKNYEQMGKMEQKRIRAQEGHKRRKTTHSDD
jgi:hypothetical protein